MEQEKLKDLIKKKIDLGVRTRIEEQESLEGRIAERLEQFILEHGAEVQEFIGNCEELSANRMIVQYRYHDDWYRKTHDDSFIADSITHQTGFVISENCRYGYGFVMQNGKDFYISKNLGIETTQSCMDLKVKYDCLEKITSEFIEIKKRLDEYIEKLEKEVGDNALE